MEIPHQRVIDVARLVGTPTGGNPHQWYSPVDVERVVTAITARTQARRSRRCELLRRPAPRVRTPDSARTTGSSPRSRRRYAGTPVGASEEYLRSAGPGSRARLLTPASFLKAISEGNDPSAADKVAIDQQIATKAIKIYVLNCQNATPDVAAQVAAARKRGIAVTTVTETLAPAGATFQDWQVAQLRALAAALHRATGR